ncbi:MAG TPA: hypothetical protein VJM33_02430 [Microthrixaceae bacterium]|nr:hypothetical protein [Microthrixaceae bacterium]
MTWLPDDFEHPTRATLATGHHLRPMSGEDVDLDYPAVMSSRDRLWTIYGEAWGWPPAGMTLEQDREDLDRHARDIAAHESFLYGVFDEDETQLLGCLYIDPPERDGGADAEISWWVVDDVVGTDVEAAMREFVPRWIAGAWPLQRPRHIGHDLSWEEWLALAKL